MSLADSIVYANGRFTTYDETRVGLLTHGLNYGTGCFEGIRGYWNANERELYLLQAKEHFERLIRSAKILLMSVPHTADELVEITLELCRRNRFEQNIYIRPLVYKSAEDIGVKLKGVPDGFALIAVPFGAYYDASAGLKVGVSSWRRIDDTMAPARAKVTGAYINSALAKSEAQMNGFDEAIMLNSDGHVAEGSAANIFLVRDSRIHTPDASHNVLEGITRGSVIEIARNDLGLDVIERQMDRSELYNADELFFTGSAAGVVYLNSVDHRPIGDGAIGPITKKISEILLRAANGEEPRYRRWVQPVYAKAGAAV
jgi:branched-chain amino acid aminotransferase